MRSLYNKKIKVVFKEPEKRKNAKHGYMSPKKYHWESIHATLPRWVQDISFETMMLRWAIPFGTWKPEIGVEYKVYIVKIGVNGNTAFVLPVELMSKTETAFEKEMQEEKRKQIQEDWDLNRLID